MGVMARRTVRRDRAKWMNTPTMGELTAMNSS